jgi:hypothetical protein
MHGLDDTQAKRHVAVLHVPPIDSPQAAVRAVIVHEYRSQKIGSLAGQRWQEKIGTQELLQFRFTDEELKLYSRLARANKQSLSEWVRSVLRSATRK